MQMTTTTQLLATPMPTVLNINSFSQPNLMYNNGFLNQNSGMQGIHKKVIKKIDLNRLYCYKLRATKSLHKYI